jgi:hypothetical protein
MIFFKNIKMKIYWIDSGFARLNSQGSWTSPGLRKLFLNYSQWKMKEIIITDSELIKYANNKIEKKN